MTMIRSTYAILKSILIKVIHTCNSKTEEGQNENEKWRMQENENTKVGRRLKSRCGNYIKEYKTKDCKMGQNKWTECINE